MKIEFGDKIKREDGLISSLFKVMFDVVLKYSAKIKINISLTSKHHEII